MGWTGQKKAKKKKDAQKKVGNSIAHVLIFFSIHRRGDVTEFSPIPALKGRNIKLVAAGHPSCLSSSRLAACHLYHCGMISRSAPLPTHLHPKDLAVLKTLRDSELLRRSVFTTPPPYLLRCEPFLERKNVCNFQENGVRTRRAAIVNHYAIVNLLRRVKILRRSIFSTAGSFGYV